MPTTTATTYPFHPEILSPAEVGRLETLLSPFWDEDYAVADAEAEIRGEFTMGWVTGGGRPDDASTAFSLHYGPTPAPELTPEQADARARLDVHYATLESLRHDLAATLADEPF